VQRFIEYFFDRFEGFQKPPYHPDWKSVNLASKVPGWSRYWVAEERLKQLTASGKFKPPQGSADAQLLAGQQAKPVAPTSRVEQEQLFQEFLQWSRKAHGKRNP
jgi:hypothetical protein